MTSKRAKSELLTLLDQQWNVIHTFSFFAIFWLFRLFFLKCRVKNAFKMPENAIFILMGESIFFLSMIHLFMLCWAVDGCSVIFMLLVDTDLFLTGAG